MREDLEGYWRRLVGRYRRARRPQRDPSLAEIEQMLAEADAPPLPPHRIEEIVARVTGEETPQSRPARRRPRIAMAAAAAVVLLMAAAAGFRITWPGDDPRTLPANEQLFLIVDPSASPTRRQTAAGRFHQEAQRAIAALHGLARDSAHPLAGGAADTLRRLCSTLQAPEESLSFGATPSETVDQLLEQALAATDAEIGRLRLARLGDALHGGILALRLAPAPDEDAPASESNFPLTVSILLDRIGGSLAEAPPR